MFYVWCIHICRRFKKTYYHHLYIFILRRRLKCRSNLRWREVLLWKMKITQRFPLWQVHLWMAMRQLTTDLPRSPLNLSHSQNLGLDHPLPIPMYGHPLSLSLSVSPVQVGIASWTQRGQKSFFCVITSVSSSCFDLMSYLYHVCCILIMSKVKVCIVYIWNHIIIL